MKGVRRKRKTLITLATLAALPPGGLAACQPTVGFAVNVSLSKRAAEQLSERGETIVVLASYYGDPKKSAAAHANEVGQIDLSLQVEEVGVPGSGGLARITGSNVVANRFDRLSGPAYV